MDSLAVSQVFLTNVAKNFRKQKWVLLCYRSKIVLLTAVQNIRISSYIILLNFDRKIYNKNVQI